MTSGFAEQILTSCAFGKCFERIFCAFWTCWRCEFLRRDSSLRNLPIIHCHWGCERQLSLLSSFINDAALPNCSMIGAHIIGGCMHVCRCTETILQSKCKLPLLSKILTRPNSRKTFLAGLWRCASNEMLVHIWWSSCKRDYIGWITTLGHSWGAPTHPSDSSWF